jgi:hypothetical protein
MKEFSSISWKRLVPKVHRRYVAGTHLGAITTHAGELALLLDGLLSAGPTFDRLQSEVDEALTASTGA